MKKIDKKHLLNLGPKLNNGELPKSGLISQDSKSLWIGRVAQVNPENNSMYVEFRGGLAPQKDVPIPALYAGPMGSIRAMPEVGSLALFYRDKSSNSLTPITWLPSDPVAGPKYNVISSYPEKLGDEFSEVTRRSASRWRHMLPGDMMIGSGRGADLYLDNDAELCDESGNTLRIRSGDGNIIANSQQNSLFANGVWRSAGFIQRNSLKTTDFGAPIDGIDATRVTHSDGTEAVYLGGQYAAGNELFSEYRIEVEDSSELGRQINDINDIENITLRNPKVIFSMANWVGNDPNDLATYGKFLVPQLFAEEDVQRGFLNFKPLVNSGVDAYRDRGTAYGFHVPDKNLFAVDKTGKMYMYLGGSRGEGANRSLDIVAQGGKWEKWGKTADEGLSEKSIFKGGIHSEVGVSNSNLSRFQIPRSIVLRTSGQVYHEFGGKQSINELFSFDDSESPLSVSRIQDYAYVRRVTGYERLEVEGTKEVIIESDRKTKVRGQDRLEVGGSSSETVVGDKSSLVLSTYTLNALKEVKLSTAARKETIVLGSDEKTIQAGNRKTDIYLGNYETKIGVGNHDTTVGAGDVSTTIVAGSKSTNIVTGNYDVSVGAGNVSIAAAAGTVRVAGLNVQVLGAGSVDITSVLVNIGSGTGPSSGVLTSANHPCFVTGLISPGSFSVRASDAF